MTTAKQIEATKHNAKNAQPAWRVVSQRKGARAQPEGRQRKQPGAGKSGGYYRIAVRPKEQFVTFRYHDVGEPGRVQRLAGRRASGSWATQAWIISKGEAHLEQGALVGDSSDAKNVLGSLRSEPKHIKGDVFQAKDRRNVPEREKPTEAQKETRATNIKKAQTARRKAG